MEDIKGFERDVLKKITPKRSFDWMRFLVFLILGFLIIYVGISLFTKKEKIKEPIVITMNLDSLKRENQKLSIEQKKFDSVNAIFHMNIERIDSKLDTLKLRTVVIKEYYHDAADKSNKYTFKQIDSFFKRRYKY